MEGLSALHRRVGGIDVHRMLHVVTVSIEQPDGSVDKQRGQSRYPQPCPSASEA
jgi:hypothetical protein